MSSMVEVVGLDVRWTAEVEADPLGTWAVELDPGAWTWVATLSRPIVVVRGDAVTDIVRGGAALVRPGAAVRIATSPSETAPPVVDAVVAEMLGTGGASGVHHGSAVFGALADEVLALPDVLAVDVVSEAIGQTFAALDLLTALGVARRRGVGSAAAEHTAARGLVLAVLGSWRPPVLRDNSIRQAVAAVLDPDDSTPVAKLPRPRSCSISTLRRRFVATTGRTPHGLDRWWTWIRVRAASGEGLSQAGSEAEVTRMIGFAHVRSLRRFMRSQADGEDRRPQSPAEAGSPFRL